MMRRSLVSTLMTRSLSALPPDAFGRDAAEGGRFAVGIALPENHVVDVLGVDT